MGPRHRSKERTQASITENVWVWSAVSQPLCIPFFPRVRAADMPAGSDEDEEGGAGEAEERRWSAEELTGIDGVRLDPRVLSDRALLEAARVVKRIRAAVVKEVRRMMVIMTVMMTMMLILTQRQHRC
jgi:hypothetical protein